MNAPRKINPSLREALDGNYRFEIFDYIGRGFDIVKEYTLEFIGFTILYIIIIAVAGSITSYINIPIIGDSLTEILLSPSLNVGFYIVAYHISTKREYYFEQFWEGFKDIGQLTTVAIIQFAASSILIIPFVFLSESSIFDFYENIFNNPDLIFTLSAFSILFFILLIPLIYLYVSWIFAPHFVVFYKMSAWDAMETSRKIVSKKWLEVFGFSILLGLIMAAGFILLCVGILYTLPAMMCATYVAFEDVTKFYEEESTEDDILDHLVD